ncbi:MAG TPA: SiaB family protein kinase [Bacteroidales bacterium]|nr:SiaB family protein kinase [Bacteroidales bacterium]
MSFNVDEFFNKLNTGNVILSYKGSITTEVINGSLEEIEAKLDEIGESSKIKKKIYNVLVESLQNLYHHVDDMPDDVSTQLVNKFGILVISCDDNNKYRISCGNFISSEKIKYLKDKIDKINSLSQNELKDMYKFILNHQKLSAKGGGGLGLVDIARKTGHKMEYSFMNHNNDYYFFNLDIFVS